MKEYIMGLLMALLIAALEVIFRKVIGDDLIFSVLFTVVLAAMIIAFLKYSKDEK
jgi:prolipoprotein diacylglyceryltransferase